MRVPIADAMTPRVTLPFAAFETMNSESGSKPNAAVLSLQPSIIKRGWGQDKIGRTRRDLVAVIALARGTDNEFMTIRTHEPMLYHSATIGIRMCS